MPDLDLTQETLESLAAETVAVALTQAPVEIMSKEVIITKLVITQTPVGVIASEPNLAFSLSQVTLLAIAPVDQVLPDSGAFVSCFEIFPSGSEESQ